MNAQQRAKSAAMLAEVFPAGAAVGVVGQPETWWVQGRYCGQHYNRVQLVGAFSKRRMDVRPLEICRPPTGRVR